MINMDNKMGKEIINNYRKYFNEINSGELYEAENTLKSIVKKEEAGEGYLNARRYLGMLYLEMENFDKAISELSMIVKIKEATKKKKFRNLAKECPEGFDKEEEERGHLAWVYHDLGMAYLGKADCEMAEKYLLKAYDISKDKKNIFRNDLGWLYYKWNKPEEAIEKFKASVNQGDNSGFPHFYLGLAEIKAGRLVSAKEWLNEAISIFDTNAHDPYDKSKRIFYELMKASALNNLGRIEMDNGEYRKSKRLFLEGLAICERQECQEYIKGLSPRRKTKESITIAALHNNLGLLHYKQGFLDEAEKEYIAALKFEELPETYNNLAVVYHEKGVKEKAESYLKNALRLDSQTEVARANLNRLVGGGANWWDWWFKPGTSGSSLHKGEWPRRIVGSFLVFALLVMVCSMMCTSFSGSEISVLGISLLSFGEHGVNTVQEDIYSYKVGDNSTSRVRETTSTKTTTTTTAKNGSNLIDKITIAALLFFFLVHPQIKIFSFGAAKFEMETASISGSPMCCAGTPSS
ncbi:MAG: tetratricopeptide repeat protein [Methanothrix sp.]|jgi:tetratricopeptide (TPR) repeat protein|uniref:tetratricopeptide repeat protein n=3 Tax=Methanothrix sp. TaxID=90426 RepID=UPI003BAEC237